MSAPTLQTAQPARAVQQTSKMSVPLEPTLSVKVRHYMSERGFKFLGWTALTLATGFFVGKAIAVCVGFLAFFYEKAAINRPKEEGQK